MTELAIVADFAIGETMPSPADLAEAAALRGARFLAADVEEGDGEIPEARSAGRRIARLDRFAAIASRHRLGLFLRLRDTLAIAGLRTALGVHDGARVADLRERLLVVVDGERAGKRLRREAPELPSALELPAARRRGLLRFTPPNYQRAAADADDLVVPWGRIDAARLASRVAPQLARRGARLWISCLAEEDVARAREVPAAGLVVRCALDGGRLDA